MDADYLRERLPDDPDLQITDVRAGPAAVTVEIVVTTPAAVCPKCGQASDLLHSRYTRRVNDLPCCGRTLTIVITARKFRVSAR
jgi:transposase